MTTILRSLDTWTLQEKVLDSARFALSLDDKRCLSHPELVVACFQHFPKDFSLKGYEGRYPDSNKVATTLFGRVGLIKRGFLSKDNSGFISLTVEGKLKAAGLILNAPPSDTGSLPASLPAANGEVHEQPKGQACKLCKKKGEALIDGVCFSCLDNPPRKKRK